MSHFTVAVIHDEDESVEELLAPFQENNMGDCPEDYLEFEDEEDEYRKEYEEGGTTKIKCLDGQLRSPYDDYFRKGGEIGIGPNTHRVPENLERVEVKHKDVYKTFEDFMREWHGMTSRDEKTGRYGYWTNPNSHWDWYQIGGRWKDMLKLKEGTEPFMQGEASWTCGETYVQVKGWCDSARLRDIDFEGIKEHNLERAKKWWEEHEVALKLKGENTNTFWRFDIRKDDTLETYLSRVVGLSTYALIVDGEWIAPGEMGWFGSHSETSEERDDWNEKEFNRILNEQIEKYPDKILTIVDCHT